VVDFGSEFQTVGAELFWGWVGSERRMRIWGIPPKNWWCLQLQVCWQLWLPGDEDQFAVYSVETNFDLSVLAWHLTESRRGLRQWRHCQWDIQYLFWWWDEGIRKSSSNWGRYYTAAMADWFSGSCWSLRLVFFINLGDIWKLWKAA